MKTTSKSLFIFIGLVLFGQSIQALTAVSPIAYNRKSLIAPPNSQESSIGETSNLLLLNMLYDIKVDGGQGAGQLSSIDPQLTTQETQQSKLASTPLFYPTPFHLREGSQLGYKLTGNYDIELRIYSMHGYELYQVSYPAGIPGKTTSTSYNTIAIGTNELGSTLPSGIYFFVLMSEGNVIGKGKFALKS